MIEYQNNLKNFKIHITGSSCVSYLNIDKLIINMHRIMQSTVQLLINENQNKVLFHYTLLEFLMHLFFNLLSLSRSQNSRF